jgi:hypothetical protein
MEIIGDFPLPLPNHLHTGSLRTLGAIGDFTFNFVSLIERFESFSLNGRKMNEYVLSVFHCYESIPLLLVEPLNLTFHVLPPVKCDFESKDSFPFQLLMLHGLVHELRFL